MINLTHILKKHRATVLGILSVLVIIAIYISSTVRAAGPFPSGTELDPDCTPGAVDCIVTTGGGGTLEDVLGGGNETGANDISVDATRKIYSTFGNDTINLIFNGPEFQYNNTNSISNRIAEVRGSTIDSSVKLQSYDGSAYSGELSVSPDFMTITSDAPTFPGIQYAANYAGDYTDRSLVDKEYVDSVAGGGGGLLSASLTLSQAEIETIGTVPVEIIPAPDPGEVIEIIAALSSIPSYAGNAYSGSSPSITLVLKSPTGVLQQATSLNGFLSQTSVQHKKMGVATGGDLKDGESLVVSTSGGTNPTCASSPCSDVKIYVFYRVLVL